MNPKKQNWWSKHWGWALPCGCLGLVLILGGTITAIALGVMKGIGSTEVCQQAVERAQASPALTAEIGSPIETGWLIKGSINLNGASGEADLAVPLIGPSGKAKLHLEAELHAGEWSYQLLEAEVEASSNRIDLLKEP